MARSLRPSTHDLIVVALSVTGVVGAAAVQHGVVLGIPLEPGMFVIPVVVGTVFGLGLTRLLRARQAEQQLREDLEQQAAEVGRLNAQLSARVADGERALEEREAELLQAQKMESLGRLAGGIAHDFNNLLTAVVQGAALVEDAADEPETVREVAGDILLAARRGAALTRKLLALSRKRRVPHPPQPVALDAIVKEVLPLLTRLMGGQVRVVHALESELPAMMGDRVHLEQIVLNLCVNARDAMPDGGTLRLELRAIAPGQPLPAGLEDGGRGAVELRVSDTGQGIDSAELDHIFEPFYTTKEAGLGTGLGLSVVHSLVQGAGGTVQVDSRPGAGTRFTLTWPAVDAATQAQAAPPAPPAEHAAAPPPGRQRVLLIDDESSVREMMARALRSRGHTVVAAAGGDAAEALARTEGDTFDLVLSDVRMPGRSGRELVPLWQDLLPSARIVLMTGFTEDQNLGDHTLPAQGVERLLRKPVELSALDDLLGGRQRQGTAEDSQGAERPEAGLPG